MVTIAILYLPSFPQFSHSLCFLEDFVKLMPFIIWNYAAFVSVLHMYESFGWWRRADYLQVHFAESWNELHHLLTMEVCIFPFLYSNGVYQVLKEDLRLVSRCTMYEGIILENFKAVVVWVLGFRWR